MKIVVKEEAKNIVRKINYTASTIGEINLVLTREECKKIMKYIEYLERIEDEDLHKYDEVYEKESETGELEDGDNNG